MHSGLGFYNPQRFLYECRQEQANFSQLSRHTVSLSTRNYEEE